MSSGLGRALVTHAGLTGVGTHRRLLVVVHVDTLGTGAFLPLTFLYLSATDVPLGRLGLVITFASLVALPVSPLAGYLADRFDARSVLVAQNLASAGDEVG